MEISAHKMEFMNRGSKEGFKAYFSNRQEHFQDVFGREFSDQAAVEEFDKIREMKWSTPQEMFD
jgi:hypothetical protein